MKTFTTGLLFLCVLFFRPQNASAQEGNLPVAEFDKGIARKHVQLLDVRTAGEYQSGHIRDAMQADWLDSAAFRQRVSALDKSKPVYTYCLSGGRSGQAMNWLRSQGYEVYNLDGGMKAWQAANMPVVATQTGKQTTFEAYKALIPKDKIVLVDFSAEWCPPCVKMIPTIDSLLASDGEKFTLVKVEAGSSPDLEKRIKINIYPTFIIYKHGKETWRSEGITRLERFKQQL